MAFTDADLIARVLAQEDHQAFAELVRRHQSPVRAFLGRMTRGDLHLADDLAQQTFLKAWQKLGTYRSEAKFSTWLFGIAYNEFRDMARKRTELLAADVKETLVEPEQTDIQRELRLDLTDALNKLHFAERAAILLCCQMQMTHEEAAKILDCPAGTVKTNILRGKEKMKRWLSL